MYMMIYTHFPERFHGTASFPSYHFFPYIYLLIIKIQIPFLISTPHPSLPRLNINPYQK
jgi:hypothetical protein